MGLDGGPSLHPGQHPRPWPPTIPGHHLPPQPRTLFQTRINVTNRSSKHNLVRSFVLFSISVNIPSHDCSLQKEINEISGSSRRTCNIFGMFVHFIRQPVAPSFHQLRFSNRSWDWNDPGYFHPDDGPVFQETERVAGDIRCLRPWHRRLSPLYIC